MLSEAPPDKIGEWIGGLDVELVGLLLLNTSAIYDLSEGAPPDEPDGPVLSRRRTDCSCSTCAACPRGDNPNVGLEAGPDGGNTEPPESARAVIRIIDSLYRSDRVLARRLLVGGARRAARRTLQEMAYRWRSGRMADLGFADHWEALEVYRELDPATVQIGEPGAPVSRVRPLHGDGKSGDSLRAPLALIDRLGRPSPFSRAVGALTSSDDVAELHFALVALGNRVLAADRVTPGDDDAVAAVLERMLATLDIGVEFLAHGDDGPRGRGGAHRPGRQAVPPGGQPDRQGAEARARARAQRPVRARSAPGCSRRPTPR